MDILGDSSSKPLGKRVPASDPYPYSDSQLDLIAAALWSHYDYAVMPDGKGHSWNTIAEAIAAYTEVSMGYEAVRRFAKSREKGKRPVKQDSPRPLYQEGPPKPENIKAIADYLTHPDIAELSAEALEEEASLLLQPALRLREYLRQKLDDDLVYAPSDLSGTYRAMRQEGGRKAVIELVLDIQPSDGIILVSETRVIEDTDKARRESRGWAILTPEDNMLFFMKDAPYDRNHYWSLAGELNSFSLGAPVKLPLLRQEYPPEIEGDEFTTENVLDAMHRHIDENIFVFEKTFV